MGTGKQSLPDWKRAVQQYLVLTQTNQQDSPFQTAVVCSLLGEQLKGTWLRLGEHPDGRRDSRTLVDLFAWLEDNTLERDRKEDMLDNMERLQWTAKTTQSSVIELQSILARGVGDPNYTYPCSVIVSLVVKGLRAKGLSHFVGQIAFQPDVRGEATAKPWNSTPAFLNHLVGRARQWLEDLRVEPQDRRQPDLVDFKTADRRQPKRQKGQQQPQQQHAPRAGGSGPYPAPLNLGPKPPLGVCEGADKEWCKAYQLQLYKAGHKSAEVCYYCKSAGHQARVCKKRLSAGRK